MASVFSPTHRPQYPGLAASIRPPRRRCIWTGRGAERVASHRECPLRRGTRSAGRLPSHPQPIDRQWKRCRGQITLTSRSMNRRLMRSRTESEPEPWHRGHSGMTEFFTASSRSSPKKRPETGLPMTGQVFRVLVREDLNTHRHPRRFLANGLCAGAPNPQVFVRSHDSPFGATHVSHVGDACQAAAGTGL
jgi:hypothetical protein